MKWPPFTRFIFPCFFLFIFFTACNHKNPKTVTHYQPTFYSDTSEKNILIFGFPSFSYGETSESFIKYLNTHLSEGKIKIKACLTYDEYLSDLKNNKFDITLISGVAALGLESAGYSIVGKINNDNDYTGIIFTKKELGIKRVADLKGKRIGIVPFRMVPGTMMPLYYLYQNGLDVNHDIIRADMPSYESAIIATYLGKTEAGVCLKRNWDVYVKKHPETLLKVDLKWETPPLINNALLIKNSVNSKLISQLTNALFLMNTTSEGKLALNELGINGFEKADRDTYKPMLVFKKKYDAVIQ